MNFTSELEKFDHASDNSIFADENRQNESLVEEYDSMVDSRSTQSVLPHIKRAFSNFLQCVPTLYNTLPQDYGSVMMEIFRDAFRCNDEAKQGLIEVLINTLDETLLSEYLEKLMARETAVLTEQSPFRVKVLQFYKRWTAIIDPSDSPSKEDNDSKEIRGQLKRLEKALSIIRRELPPIDLDSLLSFYCDDEVINTVESILSVLSSSGPIFWSQLKKDSYQAFLKELDLINSERFRKKASAHDNTLIGANAEITTLLNLLTLGKPQMPLQQIMLKVIKVLAIKTDKLEERLGAEKYVQSVNAHNKLADARAFTQELIRKNAEQEKIINDLETRLRVAEARCATLPLLKEENLHLKQKISSLDAVQCKEFLLKK